MRLVVDAGNTRLKWHLLNGETISAEGVCRLDEASSLDGMLGWLPQVERIAVSTVMSEDKRQQLVRYFQRCTPVPIRFYWSEVSRRGLKNSYSDVFSMGADRWHAMYAGWCNGGGGFAVVDAGSAITVDYVSPDGCHQGGYILAGKKMMLRSLRQDAARIGFDVEAASAAEPGTSTTECVQHGLIWLWKGLVERLRHDCSLYGLARVFITGGDAHELMAAGLSGEYCPGLVLEGLAAVDSECGDL